MSLCDPNLMRENDETPPVDVPHICERTGCGHEMGLHWAESQQKHLHCRVCNCPGALSPFARPSLKAISRPFAEDYEVAAAQKIGECTCVEPPERDDSGMVLHASYCLVAIAGRARTPFGPGRAPERCYICGDPDDHLGLPHGEVTGDGKTRADIKGGVYAEHKRLRAQVDAVRQLLDRFKEEQVSAMLLYTWIRAAVDQGEEKP